MRIIIKKRIDRDFMGAETTIEKVIVDDVDQGDLLRLMKEAAQSACPSLAAPENTNPIEVNNVMQAAARQVFLSPERIEALRETLDEVYRAMEQARRRQR